MSQLDIYFPTTDLTETELKERKIRAGTQNAQILGIFREHPDILLTPFEVRNIWFKRGYRDVPVTSIRRSITTLTDLKYLVKTSIMRKGEYGEQNHCWTLKKEL